LGQYHHRIAGVLREGSSQVRLQALADKLDELINTLNA
jgi:hypothetical protein